MFLGTATHSRVLEPELFEQEYVVAPVGDFNFLKYQSANPSS